MPDYTVTAIAVVSAFSATGADSTPEVPHAIYGYGAPLLTATGITFTEVVRCHKYYLYNLHS